ncbi:MAG: hypothetical protein RRC07_17835 [Anaerolineae bacterium]|nr:hypothetical protein [Anaerolineae bacterium]
MTRDTKLLLLIAAILVLASAFLLVDFRLLQSNMAVNSQTERYTLSVDEANALPMEQALDLYVQASAPLEEALTAELSSNPYIGTVTVREEPLQAAANTVLVVRVEEPATLLWTPVYVGTDATAQVVYASDGEVDWIEETPVVLETSDPPQPTVRVRGTMDLDGNGYGLLSRPGYYSYLAGELAGQIDSLLETQLAGATG